MPILKEKKTKTKRIKSKRESAENGKLSSIGEEEKLKAFIHSINFGEVPELENIKYKDFLNYIVYTIGVLKYSAINVIKSSQIK
jgi:hypothetical protein